jgi:hypothetical protein
MGFGALVLIFRFKSFREVVQRGREHRRAEEAPDKVTPASSF